MKGNVINLNTLHLNSVRLNGIGKVQSVSLKGGSTEDPVFPPVEPPIEPEPTPTYTLSASVTNGKVSATRNGSAVNLPFTANEGDVIVLSVTPNDGYTFEGWADGNTDNPRTITMNADVALSAQCVEVVVPSKYIQFEDAEVERVLMSKGVSSDGVGITMEDAAAVTSISTWFKGNTAITSFDEFRYFTGVKTLDRGAFEGCSNLARLPIEHIVVFNSDALYGCTALSYEELNLADCTTFGINVLYGVKVKKLNLGKVTNLEANGANYISYGDKSVLEEVTINNVTQFKGNNFRNYSSLRKVNVDWSKVTYIGEGTFNGCSSLEIDDLAVPNLATLGNFAFVGVKIKKISNLGSITTILSGGSNNPSYGDRAILEEMVIPASVTLIKGYALYNYSALSKIICHPTTPPTLESYAFNGSTCPIYVPDASVEAYKTAANWSSYASRIKGLSEYNG